MGNNREISVERLQQLRDKFVENRQMIEKRFTMSNYFESEHGEPLDISRMDETDETISGCIIGWFTCLFENPNNYSHCSSFRAFLTGDDLTDPNLDLFGLGFGSNNIFDYLVSSYWGEIEIENTFDKAIERIDRVINGYIPECIIQEIYKAGEIGIEN